MADELEIEEGDDKPKRSKKIIIIVLLVIILGAGGAGAAFFMMGSAEEEAQVSEVQEGQETQETAAPVQKKEVLKVDPSAMPEPNQYYNMIPEFVINLAPGSEKTYLVVNISLMTRDETILEFLKTNDPLLRSLVIEILTAQRSQDLGSYQGKKDLKALILEEIQSFIKAELGVLGIEKILFTHFIME